MYAAAIESMLEQQLSIEQVPPELTRFLASRSAGVPLFAAETLRALGDSGVISRRLGGIEVDLESLLQLEQRVDRGEASIPAVIAEGVKRRLLGLSATALGVLQIGAVLGERFPIDVVSAVSALGEEVVIDATEELLDAKLIRREPEEDSYRLENAPAR